MFCKIFHHVFNIVSRSLAHQYHISRQIIDSREGAIGAKRHVASKSATKVSISYRSSLSSLLSGVNTDRSYLIMAFYPCGFDEIWVVSLCSAKVFLLVFDDLNKEVFDVH